MFFNSARQMSKGIVSPTPTGINTEMVLVESVDEEGYLSSDFVPQPLQKVDSRLTADTFSVQNSIKNGFNLDPVKFHVQQSPESIVEKVSSIASKLSQS